SPRPRANSARRGLLKSSSTAPNALPKASNWRCSFNSPPEVPLRQMKMAIDSNISPHRQKRFGNAALAFVAIFWLGLLCGISFLATPVKFQVASLDLPVALEVGKVTFALLAKVEWL